MGLIRGRRFLSLILMLAVAPGGLNVLRVAGADVPPPVAEVQLVGQLLADIHIRGSAVPPSRYAEVIPDFMADLDPRHMVFLDTDHVALSARFGAQLHAAMNEHGRIDAAGAIYERYAMRAKTRATWIAAAMSRASGMVDDREAGPGDRRKTAWPASDAEADDLWERRLQAEVLDEVLGGQPESEARSRVRQRYEAWIAAVRDRDRSGVDHLFLNAVCRLYDAHTAYVPAAMFQSFARDAAPGFAGIGALIGRREEFCVFQELLPNGPAERSGRIRRGDRIVAVGPARDAMVDVAGWGLTQVVDRLKGQPGSDVLVTIQPVAAPDSSIRETVKLSREMAGTYPSRAIGGVVAMPDTMAGAGDRWGVITLRTIYGTLDDTTATDEQVSASLDVGRLIQRLEAEGVRGLVLDLRGNTGGLLNEAVDVAGVFVGRSPIIQLKNSLGRLRSMSPTKTPVRHAGPLVVLVDTATSAGAEIIAAAVQDHGRGIIVGPGPTNGNGTIQAFLELGMYLPARLATSDAGALRLTAQVYYRPNGSSIQQRGVAPDILLSCPLHPSDDPDPDAGHELPWDQVVPVARDLVPFDSARLAALREQSETRQATEPEFARCRAMVEKVAQLRQDARSLHLERRQRVRAEYAALLTATSPAGPELSITPIVFEEDAAMNAKRASDPFRANLELREALRILADLAAAAP